MSRATSCRRRISINGKFLSAAFTGVHLTATQLILALDALLADCAENERLEVELLCPRNARGLDGLRIIRQRTVGRLVGQPWEQVSLPLAARGSLLLNLCNLGPLGASRCLTLMHDALVFTAPDSFPKAFRWKYRAMLPLLGRRHLGILTVSEHSRSELASVGVCVPERCRVVYNGVEHVRDAYRGDERALPDRIPSGRYALALASTLPRKNVAVLFEALAGGRIDDIGIVLYGAATRDDFARAGVAVPDSVVFAGFVDAAGLAMLMSRALALCFPSTSEGFGLPPLEAMALGCPAVVAPCGALPELCGEAALYAAPAAPEQWVRCLRRLADDGLLRDRMQALGLARASRFTWRGGCVTTHGGGPGDDESVLRKSAPRSDRALVRCGRAASAGSPVTVAPISVVVASSGRPRELGFLLERLARQTLAPTRIVLSVTRGADLPPLGRARRALERIGGDESILDVVSGERGSCTQRNLALDRLGGLGPCEADALTVFYDDDFVPSRRALEGIARSFAAHPRLVGCDGAVLADGATGPGIGHREAERIVDAHDRVLPVDPGVTLRPGLVGLYGCNMAFSSGAITDLRFDERLAGYGWLEDIDFANRVVQASPGTTLGTSTGFAGVHRGVKTARGAGRVLGYSQVANPVYLMRKGSMTTRFGARIMARNVGANLRGSLHPEPWVDRRGRLAGNLAGLRDLVLGRLDPGRVRCADAGRTAPDAGG